MTEDQSKDQNSSEEANSPDATPKSTPAAAPDASVAEAETKGAEESSEDPLAVARAEAAQFRDKMLRTAADFDNFRKRTRREISEAEVRGRDNLLRDLLPVFDNLERASEHAEKPSGDVEKDFKGLSDGIGLVVRQFHDALGRLDIERVESIGQPFDPSVHEAIQHLETDEHPPGSVAAEAHPAYRQGERLVRPALVVVAKAPSVVAEETSDGEAEDADIAESNEAEAPAGQGSTDA